METKRTGLVLADLHIGVLPILQTYKELNYLKEYLRDKHFSFIIIAGDFFDKKLYSGEEYIVAAQDLCLFLISKCDKLRMIEGTKSHDNMQYSIFKQYTTLRDDVLWNPMDVKIIHTVEEEMLFPDMKVLYIPEEYLYDKKEYYADFLAKEKEYDYVFGHGVIQEAMTNVVRNTKSSSQQRKKPPVFTTAELEYICKGEVYFGHYHVHTNIHDKVFYVGSYSRFHFGEEEPKGFYEISMDDETYEHHFVENISTEQYITISYSYNHKFFQEGIDLIEEFNKIKKKKKQAGTEHLKLVFNIPDDYPNAEYFINLVNETFHETDGIKVEIVNGYIANKRVANKEKFQEVKKKFGYVFDKNADIEDILSPFIKERMDRDIPPDKIKTYLNFKATDLIK